MTMMTEEEFVDSIADSIEKALLSGMPSKSVGNALKREGDRIIAVYKLASSRETKKV